VVFLCFVVFLFFVRIHHTHRILAIIESLLQFSGDLLEEKNIVLRTTMSSFIGLFIDQPFKEHSFINDVTFVAGTIFSCVLPGLFSRGRHITRGSPGGSLVMKGGGSASACPWRGCWWRGSGTC